MRIPSGPSGRPTVSASQFRTYGAADVALDDQEADEGCPRLYFAKYVAEEKLPPREWSYELAYGSMFHRVLYMMEEDGLDPDAALQAAWDDKLPFSAFEEARGDLHRYIERGATPRDRYATLAVEVELEAVLFTHPDAGEVRYRGVIDWIGVDPDDPRTLHIVDYKTNRSPFRNADLLGDVQTRSYHWLLAENVGRFIPGGGPVNIVVHLDAVKFREVTIRYTDSQIDDWHSWAVAIAMTILADEKHEPTINTYCGRCPIRHDCPAFQGLPATGEALVEAKQGELSPEQQLEWRDRANRVRLVLEKSVKAIDDKLKADALQAGGLAIGQWVWEVGIETETVIDLRALHAALGDRFYDVVTTSKTAIARHTGDADPSTLSAVQAAISQIAVGTKATRRKA